MLAPNPGAICACIKLTLLRVPDSTERERFSAQPTPHQHAGREKPNHEGYSRNPCTRGEGHQKREEGIPFSSLNDSIDRTGATKNGSSCPENATNTSPPSRVFSYIWRPSTERVWCDILNSISFPHGILHRHGMASFTFLLFHGILQKHGIFHLLIISWHLSPSYYFHGVTLNLLIISWHPPPYYFMASSTFSSWHPPPSWQHPPSPFLCFF